MIPHFKEGLSRKDAQMSNRNMIALNNAMIVILFLITFLLSRSVFALEIKYSNVNPFDGGHFGAMDGYILLGG
jgi:hypothetical protein